MPYETRPAPQPDEQVDQELFIPGPLPGMNEIIAAAKGGHGRGNRYAKLKQLWCLRVKLHCRVAKIKPAKRLHIDFCWREQNRQRNKDNIAAGGRKMILDGLVWAGVIPNDGWKEIASWTDTFEVVAKGAGVWLVMKEVD